MASDPRVDLTFSLFKPRYIQTGVDPFTISEDATFPATVGDFVRAYENVPA